MPKGISNAPDRTFVLSAAIGGFEPLVTKAAVAAFCKEGGKLKFAVGAKKRAAEFIADIWFA